MEIFTLESVFFFMGHLKEACDYIFILCLIKKQACLSSMSINR